MSIGLGTGIPGSGKSYSSVADYALPCVKSGRPLVTNLPLVPAPWRGMFPQVEIYEEMKLERIPATTEDSGEKYKFYNNDVTFILEKRLVPLRDFYRFHLLEAADYQKFKFENVIYHVSDKLKFDVLDSWLMLTTFFNEQTNLGCYFILDECHEHLPKRPGQASSIESYPIIAVEMFISRHRHHGLDVLLLTQNVSKLNNAISKDIEFNNRYRKLAFLGLLNKYIIVKCAGVDKSAPKVAREVKSYDSRYFALYKSYTGVGVIVNEQKVVTKAWYKHWIFVMFVIVFSFFVFKYIENGGFKLVPTSKPVETKDNTVVNKDSPAVKKSPAPEPKSKSSAQSSHPLMGRTLSYLGYSSIADKTKVYISVDGNQLQPHELLPLGYSVLSITRFAVVMQYDDTKEKVYFFKPSSSLVAVPATASPPPSPRSPTRTN